VIDMAYGADIDVRLAPVELLFRHVFRKDPSGTHANRARQRKNW
jgi:hypothetical protein